MKLLYTKRSPYARKVRIMALEKNIPLEMVEVDLANKPPELIKANPLGKVPVLVLDSGETLVDSPVICEYMDNLKLPLLIPKEERKRLAVLHFTAIADGLMDCAVTCYMEKVRHPDQFDVNLVAAQKQAIERGLKFFEEHLDELKDFNLASIAVACAIGYINFRLPHCGPTQTAPKLAKWYEEFSKRPSLAQTVPG